MLTISKNQFKLESYKGASEEQYVIRFYDGTERMFEHMFKNHDDLMKSDSFVLTRKIPTNKYNLSSLIDAHFAVEDILKEYKRRIV